MLTFLNCASPNIYISQSVDATSKRKSFSELKVAIRLRLGCALSPYKCSCYKRVNWAVSLFSLSGFFFKVNKYLFIQKYFQIFSWGDETTFFLCFPLSSLSFKRPILPLRRRLLFLRMCRRARQENDEARRRGKYKIKL